MELNTLQEKLYQDKLRYYKHIHDKRKDKRYCNQPHYYKNKINYNPNGSMRCNIRSNLLKIDGPYDLPTTEKNFMNWWDCGSLRRQKIYWSH